MNTTYGIRIRVLVRQPRGGGKFQRSCASVRVGVSGTRLRSPMSWALSTHSRPMAWSRRFTACHQAQRARADRGKHRQQQTTPDSRVLASSAANDDRRRCSGSPQKHRPIPLCTQRGKPSHCRHQQCRRRRRPRRWRRRHRRRRRRSRAGSRCCASVRRTRAAARLPRTLRLWAHMRVCASSSSPLPHPQPPSLASSLHHPSLLSCLLCPYYPHQGRDNSRA